MREFARPAVSDSKDHDHNQTRDHKKSTDDGDILTSDGVVKPNAMGDGIAFPHKRQTSVFCQQYGADHK
jgi:hypothetical protein